MIAAGIDLGGTKIEAQVFADDWSVVDRQRVATPGDYGDLVQTLADQVGWIDHRAGQPLPVGVGAAGLINPQNGLAMTANLCASGQPLPLDIERAVGRKLTYVNDCRALALSEAIFGAGRGHHTVMSLILGTGVGGGITTAGRLLAGPTRTGGEFGHTAAPARLVSAYDLPLVTCGCGQMGCIETLVSGPGMSRIARAVMAQDLTPPMIVARRDNDPNAQKTWDIWCQLTADLLRNLTLTVDPDVIILGGGLSQISNVANDLTAALQRIQIGGFSIPQIVMADAGDASGARGAAYAALQEAGHV